MKRNKTNERTGEEEESNQLFMIIIYLRRYTAAVITFTSPYSRRPLHHFRALSKENENLLLALAGVRNSFQWNVFSASDFLFNQFFFLPFFLTSFLIREREKKERCGARPS